MYNTFEDLEGTGIHIRPSRNQTARANILNNEFINCASGGNLLSSAILLRGRFNGIVNADITNNTFRECGWNEDYPSAAIEIWGTSDVGICSSAVGNLILNCPYGIRIDGKEDCSLSGVFKNNTIANNLVGIEKGSRVDSLEVVNCILWDNTDDLVNVSVSEVTYSDISDGDFCGTNGNINTDPCFVKVGYWDANGTPDDFDDDFWVEGDYHLLEESVCINAGDPDYVAEPNETDLDGVPRVLFGRIDMGAYEYNFIEAEMDFVPEMLNCESKGDWVEAHIVLPEGYLPEDVDVNSPAVAEPIGAESEYIEVLDEGDGNYGIVAVFDREVFCEALGGDEEKELEVTVIGSFTDGVRFYGTDTIKLISDHWQHREIKN
jgi:hypothetical protein